MLTKNNCAILVIDVLNDFVSGALKFDGATETVKNIKTLLDVARKNNIPVIFCNDAHVKSDYEIAIWGEHAMKGTKGAEVVKELNVQPTDYIVPKRCYSGFFQTDLDLTLKQLGVKNLIMTGFHTHFCVRHTSADAFALGYNIYVIRECTNAFTNKDYKDGLKYLKMCYGAHIDHMEKVIKTLDK